MRGKDTLRARGISSIAVDKPTRAKLKELAGDMPVSHYVRGLAFGYIKPGGSPQEPLSGQEHEVSQATIHAVKSDTGSILKVLSVLLLTMHPTKEQIELVENSALSFLADKEIIGTFKAMADTVKGKLKSQPEPEQRGMFDKVAE